MATMLRSTTGTTWGNVGFTTLIVRRLSHVMALPPPLDAPIHRELTSPPPVLPESDSSDNNNNNNIGFGFEFPSFSFGGSMELMAVPKRKVSPHKRGIRNGPRALKPTPVIVRCLSCGRVKLPHFYCCSGKREGVGEQNDSSR